MPSDRCQICRRVEDALELLDGIAFRNEITEEERIPAWRAIKQLYRVGVSKKLCQHIVQGVRSLGKDGFGPTLAYHLQEARRSANRQRGQP